MITAATSGPLGHVVLGSVAEEPRPRRHENSRSKVGALLDDECLVPFGLAGLGRRQDLVLDREDARPPVGPLQSDHEVRFAYRLRPAVRAWVADYGSVS